MLPLLPLFEPDQQIDPRQRETERCVHRPKHCDPAHRQRSHRSELNASNDFFGGCELASARTKETSKSASPMKRCITRELVRTIRKPTLTVNPYRGGVLLISTRRLSTKSVHPLVSVRAASLGASRIQLEHPAISPRLRVLRTSRPSMSSDQ